MLHVLKVGMHISLQLIHIICFNKISGMQRSVWGFLSRYLSSYILYIV